MSPSRFQMIAKNAINNEFLFRTSGREFVDLLDTLIYVVANESNLDFELFKRIFTLNAVINTSLLLQDHLHFIVLLEVSHILFHHILGAIQILRAD